MRVNPLPIVKRQQPPGAIPVPRALAQAASPDVLHGDTKREREIGGCGGCGVGDGTGVTPN